MTDPTYVRRGRPGEELDLELEIVDRVAVAEDVIELRLRSTTGAPLPRWQPGAHVDLETGEHGWRQYSLCGDPGDRDTWSVAVLREHAGRGGSRWVHERLAAGARPRVVGPRNLFVLEPAERYLFVAGGIGITPLRPMVAAVERARAPWRLVYGGRRRASMAFAAELADRYGDKVQLRPQDEYGLLDLDEVLPDPDGRTLVYCCGPSGLLTAVQDRGRLLGWDPADIRVERFSAATTGTDTDVEFAVEAARAGARVTVAVGESALEALRRAGIDVPSSCEEGVCGTCVTRVLAGSVDHRDAVLDEDERATHMTPCVSRGTGPVVLDLQRPPSGEALAWS